MKKNKIEDVVEHMQHKPYMLKMGANKLANWLKVSPAVIREAKKIVYDHIKYHLGSGAKILIFDIETAPNKGFIWSLWNKYVPPEQLETEWFCLSWSAKWLFDDKIMSQRLTGREARREDDRRIMRGIWKLLDEADIVIAHNGSTFDLPRLNTRFLLYDMNPPLPYRLIDTLIVSKKVFAFPSNKLTEISKFLGYGGKYKHEGFEMWRKSLDGNEESLQEMETYNKQDVRILEELYLRIRPWIRSHPNVGLYIGSDVTVCPVCGSEDITWGGFYSTGVSLFQSYRCNKCGAIGRSRVSVLSKEQRRALGVSIAR